MSALEHGGELVFEHVGTMVCGERLLICDVEYLPPKFANTMQGRVSLGVEVEIVPGVWQVLLAHDPSDVPDEGDQRPAPRFVLLTHERELDNEAPLEHAEVIGLLRVDSARITALDPELRDDLDIQNAVLAAPREQVPCMLTPLDQQGPERDPRGALIDIDTTGVFELHAGPGLPRAALFISL